jgi:hypothetical protein
MQSLSLELEISLQAGGKFGGEADLHRTTIGFFMVEGGQYTLTVFHLIICPLSFSNADSLGGCRVTSAIIQGGIEGCHDILRRDVCLDIVYRCKYKAHRARSMRRSPRLLPAACQMGTCCVNLHPKNDISPEFVLALVFILSPIPVPV